jgi:hypothetical protein
VPLGLLIFQVSTVDARKHSCRVALVPRRTSVTKSMPGSLRSMRKSRWPKAAMLSSKHA